jgi:hypothetical protein
VAFWKPLEAIPEAVLLLKYCFKNRLELQLSTEGVVEVITVVEDYFVTSLAIGD